VIVTASDGHSKILLHALTTQSHVLGMFLGILPGKKAALSDTSMAFLTMVLNASSAYLRNLRFYKVILRLNEELHQKIISLKEMEHRLQKHQAELQQKVLERTKELEEKNAQLQAEIKAKERIAGELGESELRYRSLFEHSPISLCEADFSETLMFLENLNKKEICDTNTHFQRVPEDMHQCARTIRLRNINRETRRLLALSPAVHPPQTLPDILHEDSFPVFLEGAAALARGERFFHTETTLRKKDGSLLYALLSYAVDPEYTTSYERVHISIIDITQRKCAEEEIRYLSLHDPLTGLHNRRFLEDELRRLDNPQFFPLSILLGDVNGLKLTNDAFGHQEGDRLLQRAATLIRSFLRQKDVAARWGGDEFIVLLPNTSYCQAKAIMDKLHEAQKKEEGARVPLSIVFGLATKESTAEEPDATIKEAEDWMYRKKLAQQRSSRMAILTSLEQTLMTSTPEIEEHALQVWQYARQIGRSLALSSEEMTHLQHLARFHDLGMVTIPAQILNRPGPLTAAEWDLVKKHPETGYRIAQSSATEIVTVAEFILAHHERWDGTGYPSGKRGEAIPLLSRIIAIADAFDVMLRGRPYKPARSRENALSELKRCAGTQFDPSLVEAFLEVLE
jgi:diguanylate cyclase (GGDEF)-like protein